MSHTFSLWAVRSLFLGLILFELANAVGILRVPLDFTWIGLIITAAFVWGVLEAAHYYFHKRCGMEFPVIFFFIAFVNVSLDMLADVFHWYSRFFWYDKMMHFIGGGVAAGIAYYVYKAFFAHRKMYSAPWWIAYVSFMTTSFLGTLYEMEEHWEDVLVRGYQMRLGDGPDTVNDLTFNLIGAAVVLGVVVFFEKRRKKAGKC